MTGLGPRILFTMSHLISITNLCDQYSCHLQFIEKLRHSAKSYNQKRQFQNFQEVGLQNPYSNSLWAGNNYSVNHRRNVCEPRSHATPTFNIGALLTSIYIFSDTCDQIIYCQSNVIILCAF